MVTIKEIREIFREMLQEHETKQEASPTSVKTDVEGLKETLVSPRTIETRGFQTKMKRCRVWKRTKFNKRGRLCYTNDRTNMGIVNFVNLQRTSGSRR